MASARFVYAEVMTFQLATVEDSPDRFAVMLASIDPQALIQSAIVFAVALPIAYLIARAILKDKEES